MPTFEHAATPPSDVATLAVPVYTGLKPVGSTVDLDLAYLTARGFTGKVGETQALLADDGTTILAVGVGDEGTVGAAELRRAAASMVRATWRDTALATTLASAAGSDLKPAAAAQAVVEGAALATYRFTTYKTDPKACQIAAITLVGGSKAAMHNGIDRGRRIADAVALARDLGNEPAGSLPPRRLAEVAKDVATASGLKIDIWDKKKVTAERLGGLLGVAQGSDEEPRMIRLAYEPKGKARGTVALVGKGITFDSGGLSIKTADGMMTMKTDMSGAAAVLAAMSVLPAIAPPVRVIGFMPCTENMTGGSAMKPGDVLRARNGKTIEVLNTDAEGRLVLSDGLSLAVEEKPDAIVDIATLTGAVSTALGNQIAGLLGTSAALNDQVRDAGARAGEQVWELPLPPEYRKHIDSEVADIKNTGTPSRAGTIMAALFLKEFVADVPWAHLDIAGTARADADDGLIARGSTGWGVRLLVELLASFRKP